jgi:hypothetical protein
MLPLIIAVLLLSAPRTTLAQDGPAQQATNSKDPQAVAIAAKALAAMGAQALPSYQDTVATGTLTVYVNGLSVKYPITIKCKGMQETRVEVGMEKGINVRIMNAGKAVIQRPDGTIRVLSSNNTIAERVNHIPLLSILAEYDSTNVSLQYVGSQCCLN